MKTGSLWKISVRIAPQAEEAVTALLERITGQPAFLYVDAQRQTTMASVYAERSSDWSPAKRAMLRAELRGLRQCGLDIGRGTISVEHIRQEDWAESWKRHFKPLEIGPALLLKPSWSRRRPKKKQALVVIDPGLSFGTGQHPTTRFCLEQLVAMRRQDRAQSFLDIGTGSGILAISGVKLGYSPVLGIDVDPESVRIARANARQNQAGPKLRLISTPLARLPMRSSAKYDLICANLIFDLLVEERTRISNQLRTGGILVLAGILRSQFRDVRAAYEGLGFRLLCSKTVNEWSSGTFGRS
jgi:ribosomal protein L11 methyltransferase